MSPEIVFFVEAHYSNGEAALCSGTTKYKRLEDALQAIKNVKTINEGIYGVGSFPKCRIIKYTSYIEVLDPDNLEPKINNNRVITL